MKVADVMSRHVEFVSENTSVEKLSILIFGRGINGVPVCRNKKVVGFITERDILAKFYPSMQEYIEDPFNSSDFEGMEAKVKIIFEMRVDEIMSKSLTTVTPETPLLRAQSLMFIEKIGRLPVVNDRGNLVGIIAKGDIFRALVGEKLLFSEDRDYNDWLSKTYYSTVDTGDRLEHEIPDLLKVFNENKVKRILDVGCGTGDHVIDLAKRGFDAIGIDRSSAMINEASKRKRGMPEAVKDNGKFIQADVKKILPRFKKELFDAVLFMGNTISHNPFKYKDVIRDATSLLTDKGIMIFQITNFKKVLVTQKRLLSFNLAKIKDEPDKEYVFLEFYDEPNEKEGTILKTFAILSSNGKRWKSSGVRNSLMAYVSKENLKGVLHKNGFTKVEFYGSSFDGKNWDYPFRKPFDELQSDWLTVIARK
ncbi:MAG: CBS domain-containing protein [Candidatus Levybacteria bacterium]|nr:CBS domain-containing protein [Candidatus Levybacteria bacterium]